jgi:hypothetical protein
MTRASESGNRKLTAATERRAETQFRQFVKALPPGAIVEWFDMDFWVFVNFRDFTDDGQEDLSVVCMTAGEKLELEGWLAFLRPRFPGHPRDCPDYYYRTDKALGLKSNAEVAS